MQKGNIVVFIMICLVGIGILSVAVWSYIKADNESKKIYEQMVDEAKKEEENEIYGYGAAVHPELVEKEEEEDEKPAEPVIFIYPKTDKGQ